MNIGSIYLRERAIDKAKIHSAIKIVSLFIV